MKKFLVLFLVLFSLSSCFFDSWKKNNTNSKNTWLEKYSSWSFSIYVPRAWEKSNWEKLIPKPVFWEVVFASVSKIPKYWFYNNLVILYQKWVSNFNSLEYSIVNNLLSKNDYKSYEELYSKNIEFIDWDKSKLYVFKAIYNENTPKAIFMQVWKVCNNNWYLLTIWLNQTVKNTEKYEKILKSFSCKK